MEFANDLYRYVQGADGARGPRRWTVAIDQLLLLMAPMAPHITAELWERRRGGHIHERAVAGQADPALLVVDTVTMVVQVNGKVRDRIEVAPGLDAAAGRGAGPGVAEGAGLPRRATPQGHRQATEPGQHRRLSSRMRPGRHRPTESGTGCRPDEVLGRSSAGQAVLEVCQHRQPGLGVALVRARRS